MTINESKSKKRKSTTSSTTKKMPPTTKKTSGTSTKKTTTRTLKLTTKTTSCETTSTSIDQLQGTDQVNLWTIVGGAIGGILALIIIVIIVALIINYRKKRKVINPIYTESPYMMSSGIYNIDEVPSSQPNHAYSNPINPPDQTAEPPYDNLEVPPTNSDQEDNKNDKKVANTNLIDFIEKKRVRSNTDAKSWFPSRH